MVPAPRDMPAEEPAEDRAPAPLARTRRPALRYRIVREGGFLRAELEHRETVDEMREFLRALVRNSRRCAVILVCVRASKPLFHVERDGLIGYLREIAQAPSHRIALLADTPDLHASHEYLELIARQHDVRVRSFRAEAAALDWFRDRRAAADRRRGGERRRNGELRHAFERRAGAERRRSERRMQRAA